MSSLSHVTSNVHAFDERHGGNCVFDGQWILYADGAMRERNPYGLLMEPSANLWERAKVKLRYRTAWFNHAVVNFQELKQSLKNQTRAAMETGYSPPPDAQLDKLKELQKEVQKHQRLVKKAQQEVDDHAPAHVKNAPAMKAEQGARCVGVMAKLDNIKI